MPGVCPQSCRAEGIPAAVKAGEAERREKPGGSISSWTPYVPGLSLDVSGGLWEAEAKGFGRERVKWMRRTINKKIDEIIQFAGENQNRISYYTVADILKDREEQIDEKQLQEAMNLLNSRGIAVVQDGEDDESYPAEDAADSFIPADVNISQRNVNIYNLMERLENDEIELSQKEFQRVMEQKSALIERFGQLLEENEFLTELKAGDQYSTIRRIERVRQLLKEFI